MTDRCYNNYSSLKSHNDKRATKVSVTAKFVAYRGTTFYYRPSSPPQTLAHKFTSLLDRALHLSEMPDGIDQPASNDNNLSEYDPQNEGQGGIEKGSDADR